MTKEGRMTNETDERPRCVHRVVFPDDFCVECVKLERDDARAQAMTTFEEVKVSRDDGYTWLAPGIDTFITSGKYDVVMVEPCKTTSDVVSLEDGHKYDVEICDEQEAQFWSVYLRWGGSLTWLCVADFDVKMHAETYKRLCESLMRLTKGGSDA